jgi:hypothetical protein
MKMKQYLESLTKKELIELLKKLELNDIIISGAFASSENAIRDMIEEDFSKEVGKIIIDNKENLII